MLPIPSLGREHLKMAARQWNSPNMAAPWWKTVFILMQFKYLLNLCTHYFCSTNKNGHGHGHLHICWPLADGQLQYKSG